jgi:nuclear transport factor 2 (NTF2) superfamily protein
MTEPRMPVPPFTHETALAKVQAAENAWNTRDPERVAAAYTVDTVWRNRDEHVRGRAEVVLWAFTEDRIAVRFQYEWHDDAGQWWRSYGNELWQFDELGYMARREASINDVAIDESELRVTPGEGEIPTY